MSANPTPKFGPKSGKAAGVGLALILVFAVPAASGQAIGYAMTLAECALEKVEGRNPDCVGTLWYVGPVWEAETLALAMGWVTCTGTGQGSCLESGGRAQALGIGHDRFYSGVVSVGGMDTSCCPRDVRWNVFVEWGAACWESSAGSDWGFGTLGVFSSNYYVSPACADQAAGGWVGGADYGL